MPFHPYPQPLGSQSQWIVDSSDEAKAIIWAIFTYSHIMYEGNLACVVQSSTADTPPSLTMFGGTTIRLHLPDESSAASLRTLQRFARLYIDIGFHRGALQPPLVRADPISAE